jgi:hypothetical protein
LRACGGCIAEHCENGITRFTIITIVTKHHWINMRFARRQRLRRLTGFSMSLVMLLFLTCQGMATAGTIRSGSVHPGVSMPAMPGCHLMQSMAKSPAGDSDCQHLVKAFDNGSTGLVWAHTPAALPAWASPAKTSTGIPASALPEHDPVVDPPPTLRLHRFLE